MGFGYFFGRIDFRWHDVVGEGYVVMLSIEANRLLQLLWRRSNLILDFDVRYFRFHHSVLHPQYFSAIRM